MALSLGLNTFSSGVGEDKNPLGDIIFFFLRVDVPQLIIPLLLDISSFHYMNSRQQSWIYVSCLCPSFCFKASWNCEARVCLWELRSDYPRSGRNGLYYAVTSVGSVRNDSRAGP